MSTAAGLSLSCLGSFLTDARWSNGSNTTRIVQVSKMYLELRDWRNFFFLISFKVSPSVKVWHDIWHRVVGLLPVSWPRALVSLTYGGRSWQQPHRVRMSLQKDIAIVCTSIHQARKMKLWEHHTLSAGDSRKSIVKNVCWSKVGL